MVERNTKLDKSSKKKLPPLNLRLEKIGLVRDWDFILHLPIRYEDQTSITDISEVNLGEDCQIEATVNRLEELNRWKKQLIASVSDATGNLQLRFLNYYPSILQTLAPGTKIRAYGTIRSGYTGLEMVHPKVKKVSMDKPLPKTLTPIYPTTLGVTQLWLRKRIDRALLDVDIKDLFTEEELRRLNLLNLKEALLSLHHPLPGTDLASLQERSAPAWQRLKFDELLAQQVVLRRSRYLRDTSRAPIFKSSGSLVKKLLDSLPFELTNAQKRCWREIQDSMKKESPMNRLVQGDVGSGKTIIAALAACHAIDNGMQAALMAPTEILASQHFKKILNWLQPLGVKTVWLTGKLKAHEKSVAKEAIASDAQIVVGTHALIQSDVKFKNLGLAIIDEQHRFGVLQRLALRCETTNGLIPHLLMLSATPIPRTLAMSYLTDLDISVIDELPPGRTPIQTKLIRMDRCEELISSLGQQLRAGTQAYWVCPLVEESEKSDLTAAVERFKNIQQLLPDVKIALLHGKMNADEKTSIMESFARDEIQLLVSTTVIEVGVDVPNATLMIIEHADRFGLSQLHQLRGRVGRGQSKSFCIGLYNSSLSPEARERLKIFRENTDGFEISRLDLKMRGPGEFLGARQSGVPMLRFADIEKDAELVEKARFVAEKWVDSADPRAKTHASRWLEASEKYLEA